MRAKRNYTGEFVRLHDQEAFDLKEHERQLRIVVIAAAQHSRECLAGRAEDHTAARRQEQRVYERYESHTLFPQ